MNEARIFLGKICSYQLNFQYRSALCLFSQTIQLKLQDIINIIYHQIRIRIQGKLYTPQKNVLSAKYWLRIVGIK